MDSFAFVIHPLHPKADVARKYPRLARLLPVGVIHFLSRYWPPLVLSHIVGVQSIATGREVEGWLLACPLSARQMLQLPTHVVYAKIIQTGRLAERLGARIVGLGAYTSVVGDGGWTVAQALDIPVTTGSSYTVSLTSRTLLKAAVEMDIRPETATLAVVGATGAIGSACARLLAGKVRGLILVGRNHRRLEKLKEQVAALRDGPVWAVTEIEAIRQAELIISTTSAGQPIIHSHHLKAGAVVCDVARPPDVSPQVMRERNDVLVVDSGLARMPGRIDLGFDYGLPPGLTFGCVAETMALALEGRFEDYTVGKNLAVGKVREIEQIAARHGFRMAELYSFGHPVMTDQIQAIRPRGGSTSRAGLGPASEVV